MNCPICEDGLNEEFDGDSWIYKCDFCQYTQYILEPDLIEMAKEWYCGDELLYEQTGLFGCARMVSR